MNLAVVIELLCFLVDVSEDREEGCLSGLPRPFCLEMSFCKTLTLPTREVQQTVRPPDSPDLVRRPERRPRGFLQTPLAGVWPRRPRRRRGENRQTMGHPSRPYRHRQALSIHGRP